jgi:hypothetical protein
MKLSSFILSRAGQRYEIYIISNIFFISIFHSNSKAINKVLFFVDYSKVSKLYPANAIKEMKILIVEYIL